MRGDVLMGRCWLGHDRRGHAPAGHAAAILMLALSAPIALAQAACEPVVETVRGLGGVGGAASAVVWWDPDGPGPLGEQLVVRGSFAAAGEIPADRVARWDGDRWHAMGAGLVQEQTPGSSALAVYDGVLYTTVVPRTFTYEGGVMAWNGGLDGCWEPVPGMIGNPTTMLEHQGTLIVAGENLAVEGPAGGVISSAVAAWDGQDWQALGELRGEVDALASDGASIWAGGYQLWQHPRGEEFTVARWDGQQWDAPAGGLTTWRRISMVAAHEGVVRVGGTKQDYSKGLARLEGERWIEEESPFYGSPSSIDEYRGRLVATGSSLEGRSLLELVDGEWQPFPGYSALSSYGLMIDRDRLVVLSYWPRRNQDGVLADGLMVYSNDQWHVLGRSGPRFVKSLASVGDEILLGGSIMAEAGWSNTFARFDGSSFSPPVDGDSTEVLRADRFATEFVEHDGTLYIGGRFNAPERGIGVCVAAIEDGRWRTLGDGLDNTVRGLVHWEGGLVAVGSFRMSGEREVDNIARWDGQLWTQMGELPWLSSAKGVMVYNGKLLVHDEFSLYEWDAEGGRWISYRAEADFGCHELRVVDGRLYMIGCRSDHANIYRLEGENWRPVGDGQPGELEFKDLAQYRGSLYAAGATQTYGGLPVLRRFDGEIWHELDGLFGGVENSAIDALAVHDGELYLGGSFTLVHEPDGLRSSSGLARLTLRSQADLDGDGALTIFDFLAYMNLFEAGDVAADLDGDGELTVLDFLAFRDAFDAGCP